MSVSVATVNASIDRRDAIAVLSLVGLVVTAIAFIVWMLRVYDNLKPMTAAAPRHTRGWVIGGWLVPFLNLVRPKQIMDDLWRANDPKLPAADDLISSVAWQNNPASPLLNLWWALWIIGGLLGWSTYRSDVTDLDGYRIFSGIDIVLSMITAGAAIAALLVVARLTLRQEERASQLLAAYTPTPPLTASVAPTALAGLLGVVSVIVFAGAFLAFDTSTEDARVAAPAGGAPVAGVPSAGVPSAGESETTSPAATPGTPTFLVDLEPGDCWKSEEYAAAAFGEVVELLAVEVVPCAQPHIGELFSIAAFPGGPSADYPGDSQVLYQGQRICTEQFEATFDSSYESSTLDVFQLIPTADSWRLGDRDVSCSVTTVYLDPINGPAAVINDQLPGNDLGILAASSCEAITDAMVVNAQLTIDVLGSLTPEQWALLETSGAVPEFERVLKRDSLMLLRADEIGCTLTELNVVFLARIDELEASTFDGQAMLTSFNEAGYWDESPLP